MTNDYSIDKQFNSADLCLGLSDENVVISNVIKFNICNYILAGSEPYTVDTDKHTIKTLFYKRVIISDKSLILILINYVVSVVEAKYYTGSLKKETIQLPQT